ncbi:MAG: esterase, partial [Planktotalea sp.]
MADYQTLIDTETWAFIERTNACYPPDTATYGVDDQRRIYDEMCATFHADRPDGVTSQDRDYGGIPCRHYSAGGSDVMVMYFHGGGF